MLVVLNYYDDKIYSQPVLQSISQYEWGGEGGWGSGELMERQTAASDNKLFRFSPKNNVSVCCQDVL